MLNIEPTVKKNHFKKRLSESQEIHKTKKNKWNNKERKTTSYNKWTEEVGDAIKQVEKTVTKNPGRHKGVTDDMQKSQDNIKKYNRCFWKKSQKQT